MRNQLRTRFDRCFIAVCAMALLAGCAETKTDLATAPHLQKQGTATQLIVDGSPFLVLGGELHNSSTSSLEYMEPIWPKLEKMNLNTALVPVTWEQVEPVEGKFDFHVVDGLLSAARGHHLRLAVLWFGSWKNGNSRYLPAWVKENQERFPRVVNKDGKTLEILSTFSEANRDADSAAFAALMRHIRDVDGADHTVIMIQMQNEVGVLGDSRDRCAAANDAFSKPVPSDLMDYLEAHREFLIPEFRSVWAKAGANKSGTWEEVFGKEMSADEIFMAWNYAKYMNHISAAGKAEYPLPTFVNTWIVQPEDKGPGDYPSGGPQAQNHDIWRAAAPSIDILAPDIYLPDFPGIVARYSRSGNPVFVPESAGGARGVASLFYAVGQFNAIGYSPFGIEEREPEDGPISKAYGLLGQMAPMILAHQGTGSIAAVSLGKSNPSQDVALGNYILHAELRKTRRSTTLPDLGYAMIISTGPDEYIIAGTDVQITFSTDPAGSQIVGLATVEDGTFKNGQFVPGRLLNGDEVQLRYELSQAAAENQSGAGIRLVPDGPTVQRVKLYRYH